MRIGLKIQTPEKQSERIGLVVIVRFVSENEKNGIQ